MLCSAIAVLLAPTAARPEETASIQATAHVEAPLGLTDAVVERGGRNEDHLPGSHLYWLYYPHRDGVVIQLSRPKEQEITRLNPEIRSEYPQVSLVSLPEKVIQKPDAASSLTLTIIFTDN